MPPESLLLYQLEVLCYDWRTDLTERANTILQKLADLQAQLQKYDDTDDQVAIAGHSTGGVVIRRMLIDPSAHSVISHAFFIDVPFRGAPKALSMVLTGCESPGGDPGIPFIEPSSLVDIALTEPVVYHLSPSMYYPEPVAILPGIAPGNREEEKEKLIEMATKCGIYYERSIVNSALAVNRSSLALHASNWNTFWSDLQSWNSAAPVYRKALTPAAFEQYENTQLTAAKQDCKLSDAHFAAESVVRAPLGWNQKLAQKARDFHAICETQLGDANWSEKAYIFYAKGRRTTQRLRIEKLGDDEYCPSVPALLSFDPHRTIGQWREGNARPRKSFEHSDAEGRKRLEYEEWIVKDGELWRRVWALSADKCDGDETVPVCSQLGFGAKANVFTKIPDDPKHMESPNCSWVWDRIIEVLQGADVSGFLIPDDEVSTLKGEEYGSRAITPLE
jgi:hypothetical protein